MKIRKIISKKQGSEKVLKNIKRFMMAIFSNPIVTKEIKQRTRGLKFSFTIAGWLLLMTLFTIMFLTSYAKPVVVVSSYRGFFTTFCILLIFLFAGFFGLLVVILSSQAIAKEKENQTLDILLSTPLTNFEIVVGKMIAAAGEAVILFFSAVPILVLLYFYGITSMGNILLIMLYVFVLILFYGSLSLLLSTVIKKSIAATVIVVSIVIASTIFSYFIFLTGAQVLVANSPQPGKAQNFWSLISISLSSAFSLIELISIRLNSAPAAFFQYSYKIKGYQIHLIICIVGTILNIYLSALFLSPLRRIRIFRRKSN
ncbi:ABC-2 family transporter [Caldicellulosiruptor bescii]|uniref:ABC-2 type transporter n=2 Tax=Caldicellulosiruptor bescii TaxID=31899 RepID=B9MLJ4_CALBD|nr:ABC transporter permease subunit [Caldicellulosiruptor bescii]ACM59202.1 ABC-2 type transporter [Caldicellulosiruptor bescii DSM 6725]PBC88342.1 ABC-2 family transporter [Caldicellulosiruptor bescii]PBC92177.1 ABC-2 family transporter [Caldicellulosiruptor bescii]PBD05013.1 ABC-2 family transporter [Caldicellulosiruptor bescii]PBD05356.1 ABC-2 family transporter [Caldicellulosiruptor bescii]